jgi:hypothetical protein
MTAIEDAKKHAQDLVGRYGLGNPALDLGGSVPEDRIRGYKKLLRLSRARDMQDRVTGTLGWDDLLLEELLEVFTSDTDAERYSELIQLAGTSLVYAEAVKRRR